MKMLTKEILNNVINENQITSEQANTVIQNIRDNIRTYVKTNNLQSLILGVSGGLDSACVAALCQEKYTGVPLIGISIPMNSTNDHREKAKWVGDNFCTSFDEFNGFNELTDNEAQTLFDVIFKSIEATNKIAEKAGFKVENFPINILKGNIKARLRMITLYDMARKTNGLVLSTDNYSEYLLGFWTICGDQGDLGPIQNIWKGLELPTIAKALGIREDIITQKPSDGLMVTEANTDEAQIGASYPYVDAIMKTYFETNENWNLIKDDQVVKNIVKRYETTHFKRIGTVNLTREEIGL